MIARRAITGTFAAFAIFATSALLWTGTSVQAAERKNFDAKAFAAAQAAGRPVLVDVWASWCPTCRAQAPILAKLADTSRFKNVLMLRVDFDRQKDVLRQLKVQRQSTLVVFRGKREVGRSTGDTNPDSIAELLAKAL